MQIGRKILNKHLLLILLGFGSFGVSADCIGKKGKDFHDCLKQQLTQPKKSESFDLRCKDDNLKKSHFFSDYILTLSLDDSPSVTTHFHAIKYEYKKKIYMHLHSKDDVQSITVKDNRYDWDSLPPYQGDVFNSNGELTYGFKKHINQPHINYYLNRENLKLKTTAIAGSKLYQCEIINNLIELKKFYETEFVEVNKLKEIEKNKQLKKNKI